jgi:ankyrin repeat protein/uncharacterized glyoxalase superfamily protein PhnB
MSESSAVIEFFEACGSGDAGAARRLLATDPNLVRAANPGAPHGGWTGLHSAARGGSVETVRLLLERGADPNAREAGDNTTPLHWAAAHEHLDLVRALLDAGADVHGVGDVHELDVIGWATFYHAPNAEPAPLSPRRRELVALLVGRGARHHIFSAISVGDLDLIRQVVADNPAALARRMSRFEHGLTPLHFAMTRRRYDILDLLIELGADLEAVDGSGQTALAVAMLRGDREAMTRLHAAGAKQPATTDAADLRAGMTGMAGSIKRVVPMLAVPDVGRALDWYASIGFTEHERYGDDGVVNFGYMTLGDAAIMLNIHGKAGPQSTSLWFYTDRVDEIYQLLKARQLESARAALAGEPGGEGIAFEQDIEDMFYGARQFGIRDPNGYVLYFLQLRTEH